jgi:di/tricarboxylate transporter
MMHWDAWLTIGVLSGILVGLVLRAHLADFLFLAGLAILSLSGVITPTEALAGFSNPAMITVAALYVVAAGMRDTGALDSFARHILRRPQSPRLDLLRLSSPIAGMSAFLNNTTIVAMALPPVLDWCRKHQIAASRLLIPLSYATIAGGVCTLIGTSTNLVVHGLLLESGLRGFGFLEIGVIGVPITIVTIAYLVLVGPILLPQRRELMEQLGEQRREYMVEMLVEDSFPFLNKRVQDAGLRQLPGLFLVEIARGTHLISPIGPRENLQVGDRLLFVGVVSTIVDLQKIRGLTPVAIEREDARAGGKAGHLCEAVVSASSPMVGTSIRDARFRTVYDAAIIAVHRNGARLEGKIGDIVLRAGDTLLLQASPDFHRMHRNNPDFYLVSEVGGAQPVRHEKALLAAGILLALVAFMTLPDILEWTGAPAKLLEQLDRARVMAAVAAAVLMVVMRCLPAPAARRSIAWDVLLVIAASFGLATAIDRSGLSRAAVEAFRPALQAFGPVGAIAMVYIITNVLTELLTNNAAAALVFPIAIQTARQFGIDPHPFAITVAIAASGGFCIPIGYQTHMMVFGPGGYRFSDFVKIGLPLNILWLIVTCALVPLIWKM